MDDFDERQMCIRDSLKGELARLTAKPTMAEIALRLQSLEPVVVSEPVVRTLREARRTR